MRRLVADYHSMCGIIYHILGNLLVFTLHRDQYSVSTPRLILCHVELSYNFRLVIIQLTEIPHVVGTLLALFLCSRSG